MPRILFLIILIWVLYVVIKRFIASTQSTSTHTNNNTTPSEKFVVCSQCQCHVPESDSHITNDVIYCNNPECDAQNK